MSRMISFSIYTCIVSEKGSLWSNIAIACQEKSCKQLEAISKWPLRMLYSVLISWWQEEHFRKLLTHKKTIDNMSDDSLTCISKAKKSCVCTAKYHFNKKQQKPIFPGGIIFQMYFKSQVLFIVHAWIELSSVESIFQRVYMLEDILTKYWSAEFTKNMWASLSLKHLSFC